MLDLTSSATLLDAPAHGPFCFQAARILVDLSTFHCPASWQNLDQHLSAAGDPPEYAPEDVKGWIAWIAGT